MHGDKKLLGIEPWLRQDNVWPRDEKDMVVSENGVCYYFEEESEDA
jgi:hypothetical protein